MELSLKKWEILGLGMGALRFRDFGASLESQNSDLGCLEVAFGLGREHLSNPLSKDHYPQRAKDFELK